MFSDGTNSALDEIIPNSQYLFVFFVKKMYYKIFGKHLNSSLIKITAHQHCIETETGETILMNCTLPCKFGRPFEESKAQN